MYLVGLATTQRKEEQRLDTDHSEGFATTFRHDRGVSQENKYSYCKLGTPLAQKHCLTPLVYSMNISYLLILTNLIIENNFIIDLISSDVNVIKIRYKIKDLQLRNLGF